MKQRGPGRLTRHPWADLEAHLQILITIDERCSPKYLQAVNVVERVAEITASRVLASPKLRAAGCDGRDIAQEWWAKLLVLGFKDYQPAKGPLHRYCYRILCNLCVDAARRTRIRRATPLTLQLLDGQGDASERVEAIELRLHVRKAIQQLPRDLRVPLKLRYLRGLSARKAAQLCKMSALRINSKTFAARALLRQLLVGEHGKGGARDR